MAGGWWAWCIRMIYCVDLEAGFQKKWHWLTVGAHQVKSK